jgi:hypothetical protein
LSDWPQTFWPILRSLCECLHRPVISLLQRAVAGDTLLVIVDDLLQPLHGLLDGLLANTKWHPPFACLLDGVCGILASRRSRHKFVNVHFPIDQGLP